MPHCSDGVLRVMADEPEAVAPSDLAHTLSCPACGERLRDISARVRLLRRTLESPPVAVDLAGAFNRLQSSRAGGARSWMRLCAAATSSVVTRPRRVAALTAVALAGGLAVTPVSGWAQALVTLMHSPRAVVMVPVSRGEEDGLASLAEYGTLGYSTVPFTHPEPDAAAATADAGFPPLTAHALPAGVPAAATYGVRPAFTVSFTFSAAKARRAAARLHRTPPAMPADIDGTTVSIEVGPMLYAEYGPTSGGPPPIGTVRLRPPTIRSTGVSIPRLQAYLLAQPGVSPALAARIRAIGDPARTLPILVPGADGPARAETVREAPGSLVTGSPGYGSILTWLEGGYLQAVYGSRPPADLLTVAAGAS